MAKKKQNQSSYVDKRIRMEDAEVSLRTLSAMDKAAVNFKKGKVSEPICLDEMLK